LSRSSVGDLVAPPTSDEHEGCRSEVEVVYELTSLSEAGAHHLKQFAEGYTDYLQSWQDAIAACLGKRAES
jgi:hypothetical protein